MNGLGEYIRPRTLHLFAGSGGGILSDLLLGHRPVCAVEIEPYCQKNLHQRQKDGVFPFFPIWDDVQTFDGTQWRGKVNIVAGGFPCQDISSAGRGEGLEGKRSGLWSEMARIISEVVPTYVFVENSPQLVGRGLDKVLMDLAKMGYNAQWCVLGARHVMAPHKRDRIWILGYIPNSNGTRLEGDIQKEFRSIQKKTEAPPWGEFSRGASKAGRVWTVEPTMGRVVNGVANRVDRIKAIGNGQVPLVAATAYTYLMSQAA